jgi:hypothetical protein
VLAFTTVSEILSIEVALDGINMPASITIFSQDVLNFFATKAGGNARKRRKSRGFA